MFLNILFIFIVVGIKRLSMANKIHVKFHESMARILIEDGWHMFAYARNDLKRMWLQTHWNNPVHICYDDKLLLYLCQHFRRLFFVSLSHVAFALHHFYAYAIYITFYIWFSCYFFFSFAQNQIFRIRN